MLNNFHNCTLFKVIVCQNIAGIFPKVSYIHFQCQMGTVKDFFLQKKNFPVTLVTEESVARYKGKAAVC